ncbi:5'(3')-deoxyribonucleotidase [Sandaracinomonas limnophila]|uniref:5'(3')-deoxyribonucleotidase n=1 Tax=Sandaracinomonas limnophila TaxID=1862386 RepID=A0A437PWU0_9BACT|nr:5'(3')-deoxyribonucleotidase [Sandaracinomonas limnophila]RVU26735.1 5'(3')-deoxyribonucleotidase [Sandaracinomonas limnophila]
MTRIAIDMDDVMADTSLKIVQELNKKLNTNYQIPDLLNDIKLREEFYANYSQNNSFLWEKGFFEDIEVKPNAVEVIRQLQNHYEIFIVSAATEFPESMKEKLNWLEKHFPFIGWTHTVFCGHKYLIQADFLIDDHEKNLKTFSGTPILFSAPHNLHLTGYERVNTWDDVAAKFL